MQTEHRKAKKTTNACIACRHSKIECSGREPCDNCQRRLVKCEFTEGVNKVIVSERYLRDLKRQVQDLKCAASTDNISRRVEPGAVAQLMLQGYLSILQDLNRKLPRHHKQLVMREASGQARLLYRRRLSRIPKTTKEVGFG